MELISELKKNVFLNKCEALLLTKEYLGVYLVSLLRDFQGQERRKILFDKLKEYYAITKEENKYIKFLLNNMDKINNDERLNWILDELDRLNEETYKYFDKILLEYEDNMFYNSFDRKIVPAKQFKTLMETTAYLDELLGLTLTRKDLEEFFRGEETFDILSKNAHVLHTSLEEGMSYYGCYPQEDKDSGILTGVKICVPEINDLKSMCINVHEYKHGIDIFPYIGEILPDVDYEKSASEEEEKFKVYLRQRIWK